MDQRLERAGGTAEADRVFAALSSLPRRCVLENLRRARGKPLEELAEDLADPATEMETDGGTHGDVEALRVELYHRHLPALRRAGLIEYEEGEPIELTESGAAVREWLDRIPLQ